MIRHDWPRVSALLDELLDLDEAGRRIRLAALEDSDPALARHVLELLDLEAQQPQFLAEPVVDHLLGGPQVGDHIGTYTLERCLGEGGMGQVWLAQRSDGLFERRLALKLLRPGFASSALQTRFAMERRILARLVHPNIARLLDAGVTSDGRPFLVLEYINGTPINTYADEQVLDVEQRIALFLQVCDAVSHAHSNLIVHRDLKPSNILVTPAGQVRLLDFGIAKLLDDTGEISQIQTRTGMQAFTLHYAAPEQLRGEPITTMTDVYALGMVLYELMAGEKPYRLDTSSDAQWQSAILQQNPVRPSLAAKASGSPDAQLRARALAGDLERIILKALNKVPVDRYGSADALADDLRNYLGGWPVSARAPSLAYRTSKYVQRHITGVAITALVLLSIALAIGGIVWQSREAVREASRAQVVKQFVVALFEGAGADTEDIRRLLESGVARAERQLSDQPEARADLLGMVAQLYIGLGDFNAALAVLDRQARAFVELGRVPAYLDWPASIERARALHGLGDNAACIAGLLDKAAVAKAMSRDETGSASALLTELGHCQLAGFAFDEAKASFEHAKVLRERMGHAMEVIASSADIAQVAIENGNPDSALSLMQSALAQLRRHGGEHEAEAIELWQSLGAAYQADGDLTRAVASVREALGVALVQLPPSHPQALSVQRQLGQILIERGDLLEATNVLTMLDAQSSARLGEEQLETMYSHLLLGRLALGRGEFEQASRQFYSVRSSRISGRSPLIMAEVELWSAQTAHAMGDPELANQHLDTALHWLHGLPGRSAQTLYVRALQQRAQQQHDAGDEAAAQDSLNQAQAVAAHWLVPEHPLALGLALDALRIEIEGGGADPGFARLHALHDRIAARGDDARALKWQAAALQAELSCRSGNVAAGRAELDALRSALIAAAAPEHLRAMLVARSASCTQRT
ncbi:MAG: hypothetical protein CVV12_01680 [Gammaproteobacteria bacterium HGW-Gammaproteobacteria-2]|jgi:serine/threonine-protein kinase|nr:MAG: hypothetical protein CVV12_01680 [Gammaproteobacteria bacterium HGW-Gammaproteobacteria-2]